MPRKAEPPKLWFKAYGGHAKSGVVKVQGLTDIVVDIDVLVPLRKTEAGSIVCSDVTLRRDGQNIQWRKTGQSHILSCHNWGYGDWWAPQDICWRQDICWGAKGYVAPSTRTLRPSSAWPEVPQTVAIVVYEYSPELTAHLRSLVEERDLAEARRKEEVRRSARRSEYTFATERKLREARKGFDQARTEDEAAEGARLLFRARQKVAAVNEEAERRWPRDPSKCCPGDSELGLLSLVKIESTVEEGQEKSPAEGR